jgi:hypothetical protein
MPYPLKLLLLRNREEEQNKSEQHFENSNPATELPGEIKLSLSGNQQNKFSFFCRLLLPYSARLPLLKAGRK